MKVYKLVLTIAVLMLVLSCNSNKKLEKSTIVENIEQYSDTTIVGVWVRMSPNGPLKIHFKEDNTVEIVLADKKSVDVVSNYTLQNDTIKFVDKEGKTCPSVGMYKVYHRNFTLGLDVVDDMCNGRIKATSGVWVRPNHKELVKGLEKHIAKTNDIDYILHRGRVYLALGVNGLAKKDFDTYLAKDSTNSKVYIHRAATRFPYKLSSVVDDCSKAIALDSIDKNAYFLRGLAYYGLNDKQKGCDDFKKAIDLGFEILKEAESYKCKDYW